MQFQSLLIVAMCFIHGDCARIILESQTIKSNVEVECGVAHKIISSNYDKNGAIATRTEFPW